MGNQYTDSLPADLLEVASRLREERPEPTRLELGRMMQAARARGSGRPNGSLARGGIPMTSRFVITSMLVIGLVLGSTGGALAVSGMSSSGSAGEAQYAPQQGGELLVPPQPPTQQPAPVREEQPPPVEVPEVLPGEEVPQLQGQAPSGGGGRGPQTTRQTASGGGGELPFTGFLAIPVLVAGVALLGTGLMLRRRANMA